VPDAARLDLAEGRWLLLGFAGAPPAAVSVGERRFPVSGEDAEVDVAAIADAPGRWPVLADGAPVAAAGLELPGPAVVADDWQRRRAVLERDRADALDLVVEALPPHAELESARVEQAAEALAVAGRVRDPVPAPARLIARRRSDGAERAVPATLDGLRFAARIELAALDGGEGVWDLALAGGEARLELATALDGIPARRHVALFPAAGGVRPFFTRENGLAIRVGAAEEPDSDGSPEAPRRTAGPRLRRRLLRALAIAVHRAAIAIAARTVRPRHPRGTPTDGVHILVLHAYGVGGIIRAGLNLAGGLAADREVEILSLVRRRERTVFPVPEGVRLTSVHDLRRDRPRPGPAARLLEALPSLLMHPDDFAFTHASLRTDLLLLRRLRRLAPGVLVTTRPAFNLLAARLAPPGVTVVAQEHIHRNAYRPGVTRDIARHYRRLHALVVLTEEDRDDYAALLGDAPVRLARIPNAVPPLDGGLADPDARVVVAAGRLTVQKGFDLLLPAWEQVVAQRPGWQLRIYGSGHMRAQLRRTILDRELYDSAFLMGETRHVGTALAGGSVFVLSSRFEGFGMVIVEAMSKGVPVVTFDCQRGPAEIVTPGEDGLVVPPEDVDGLAAALLELTGDAQRRRRMSEAARITARRYEADAVAAEWRALFAELSAAGRS
jgi:glycosyltransferase involved in cell wall biosynthesis